MNTSLKRLTFGFDRFSGLYLGAAFIAVFGFLSPELFLTSSTMYSIASAQAVVAMLGLAVLIPLSAGEFDLSLGANVGLSAVLVSHLQVVQGRSMTTAIIVVILTGIAVGVGNGFLVVKLGVSSFIGTLGMASVLAAVISMVTDNVQPLPATGEAWLSMTQTKFLGFQLIFWYLIVIAAVIWWLLEKSPTGRYIYAVGGNAEAARLAGVRVGWYKWLSFILCGAVSSIAGIFYASLNGPSLTFGSALLLPAFAAAFLGFTQIKPGRFNVIGTVVAVYVLALGVRGLSYQTSAQWLGSMFNGVALILAVAFAVWRQRVQTRASAEAGQHGSADDGLDSSDGPLTESRHKVPSSEEARR